ncbi:MAG: metallopeptidase [Candidatus Tectomicrobia bacterium]|uniref:Metallopeptidase n=1 Tax=Tectimicrobiota bacterium TaxID=2528274 RepID=A0A933GJP0_UNCTE|nr:metallopeptidase [Candidatus Tectomicrobia bacterium]
MISYELAPDIDERLSEILSGLEMKHIMPGRVMAIRSRKSNSKRVIARCHGLPKIMQLALKIDAHYIIEVIQERFGRLSYEEQTKVLIHELMHIPLSFSGGFRAHNPYVTKREVEKMYHRFISSMNRPQI